jgi:hypothetical protein
MDLFKRFLRQFDMTEQLPHASKTYVTVLTTQKEIDDVIWVFTRPLTTKHGGLNKHTTLGQGEGVHDGCILEER